MSETTASGTTNVNHGAENTHEALKDLCNSNAQYFKNDNTENGQRLYLAFLAINDNIDKSWPVVLNLQSVVSNYDFNESTPANGYRSFLNVIDSAVVFGIQLNKKICSKRESVLFRKSFFTKEVENCAQLFASLETCLIWLEDVREKCPPDELFPLKHLKKEEIATLVSNIDTINQYCFHGRCLGFQFCESMRAALKFISLCMAIFSEAYYSEGSMISKATTSFMTSTRYFTDPEEKAKRIVNISQNADIEFCKAFWFLSESELMKHLPSVVSPSVSLSKIINIPTEPLSIHINGNDIDIPVPTSHIGRKPVQVRLISTKWRQGMIGEANNKVHPPSRGLLIHCHGGGFVAQSSCSHEVYLRQWAKDLDIPILSIDYSLAPQAPFPRALEEVTYAYCWALKNHQLLGSTGERVVAAGDSAGGNLLVSMSLKCLELNITPPMGLFLAYVPFNANVSPSPSRLLCVMDPLLPFGFLIRCIKAYTFPDPNRIPSEENGTDTESFEEISESDLLELQAHKSTVSDTSDTLTYGSLTSPTDENKDNGVNFNDTDINPSSSQKYVSDFLEKYVLDSDTETEANKTHTCEYNVSTTPTNEYPLQNRIATFVSDLRSRFGKLAPSKAKSGAAVYLDTTREKSLINELNFTVPSNPYISPYFASDSSLKRLPPMKILTVHLDPCLDDCVMFARKLKILGNNVTIDIVDGLPHGFLNFSLVSKEAFEASKLCTQRISELLDLDNLPPIT